MLVLSRKESQRIRLGDSIVVTIVKISGDKVRVGIEAPATCWCSATSSRSAATRLRPLAASAAPATARAALRRSQRCSARRDGREG